MIRTFIWFCYFWGSLLSYVPSYLGLSKLPSDEARLKRADWRAKGWSKNLLKLAGTEIKVQGLEQLPKEGPVLFIANHQSNFDIPLMIASLGLPVGFMAKMELSKMPFVSGWMKALQCIFIDRDDIRQQVRSINEGAEKLKKGYHLVLFPEGTRSADGQFGTFKPGGLKLAQKSGCHVVPVTINGSLDIMRKGSLIIKPAKVLITIHPPVQELPKDTHSGMAMIRDTIEGGLSQ